MKCWRGVGVGSLRSDMTVTFRPVQLSDYSATRQLVDEAFRPEDVVTFLDALRDDGCLLGEWLAESSNELVGHVAFSRVRVECPSGERIPSAMLTPLCVRPVYQDLGVGTKLMNHALCVLESNGESIFFVLGHPEYYPRAGFKSEMASEIANPWAGNPAFMVRARTKPVGTLILPDAIAKTH